MEARNAKVGAICGILALVAVISIFVIPGVGTVSSPPAGQTAQETLANFDNAAAALNVALHALYAVFFIVFLIVLGSMLKGKNATQATVGTAFATISQVLLAGSTWYNVGSTAALAGIYRDPASTALDRAAAITLTNVIGTAGGNGFGSFGFLALGVALLVYGFLMLNTRTFPNWLGYAFLADGIAWLITTIVFSVALALPPSINAIGFAVFLASLILSFIVPLATSVFMWRSATPDGASS